MFEHRKQVVHAILSSHGEASRFYVTFLDNHDQKSRFHFPFGRDLHQRYRPGPSETARPRGARIEEPDAPRDHVACLVGVAENHQVRGVPVEEFSHFRERVLRPSHLVDDQQPDSRQLHHFRLPEPRRERKPVHADKCRRNHVFRKRVAQRIAQIRIRKRTIQIQHNVGG